MTDNIFVQLVLAVIVSAGGVGGLVIVVTKFTVGIISDRLSQKFQKELEKEIEAYRMDLDTRKHASITRYDIELTLYQDLNGIFFALLKDVNQLIPVGISYELLEKDVREQIQKKALVDARVSYENAQDILNKNEPFIMEEIYENYYQILQLSHMQISIIDLNFSKYNLNADKNDLKIENHNRTKEINRIFKKNNKCIRDHLLSLELLR